MMTLKLVQRIHDTTLKSLSTHNHMSCSGVWTFYKIIDSQDSPMTQL
jgi:hypothetical protein